MPRLIDTRTLFAVTTELFAERGYVELTTQEVARRAGLNESTIYRRFGTKAGLVAAALADRLSTAPFATPPLTDDVEADLVAMTEALRSTVRAHGGAVVTLLSEAARHPELRAATAPLVSNLARAAEVLRAHQAAGRLVLRDPMEQLVLLLSPFVTAGLWERTGVPAPAAPEPATVVAAFLDGNRRG